MNCNTKKRVIFIGVTLFSLLGKGFCQTGLTRGNYPLDRAREREFYTITQDESTAHQIGLMRQIADLALIPPLVNTSPEAKYDYDQQGYVMALSNERTPKGRLWVAWIGGEDGPKAFLLAAKSDDNGKTWSKPCLAIDAQLLSFPVPRTVIIGNFWTDPTGRLWLFFDQAMNQNDGRDGLWATVCDNPDADKPVWSLPKRIWHGSMLNKPTVLSSGEWLLSSYLLEFTPGWNVFKNTFPELEPYRGVNLLVSTDQGKSWALRSVQKFPYPDWREPMIVEKPDGRLWMLTRTGKGIMETCSDDKGYTWTAPVFTTSFKQPNSRFFIRRLASSRLLLIKNGDKIDEYPDNNNGRDKLSAWLSEDDGKTWKGGLLLDDRPRITYPDGTQAPDGTLYVTYDHDRGKGEIMMAKFTEEDILAGKIVSLRSELKIIVCKPGKSG